jgi:hypothetical protein
MVTMEERVELATPAVSEVKVVLAVAAGTLPMAEMLAMEARATSVTEVQVGTVDLAAMLVTAALEETVEMLYIRAMAELVAKEVTEVMRAMEDMVVMVGMEMATHLVAPAVMAV